MDATLTLKNKPNVIGAASNFTYHWGINSGLNREHATRLAVAVSELVTDVVLFAFGELEGEMEIAFHRYEDRVEVIVYEQGEPFNPDLHCYDRRRAVEEGHFEGAGFELVRKLTDDFIYLNKGKQGKEFHLTHRISSPHITEIIPLGELNSKIDEAGEEEYYDLKPITPDDAEDISKLIYRTYRHTYYKEHLYFPRQIAISIEQKEKFGVISRLGNGQPAGYFAVLRTTDSNIGEVGEAVVAVRHRRKGLMKGMMKTLVEMAQERGLFGVFGEATTSHQVSQRVNAHFGFQSTAIFLAIGPRMALSGFDAQVYAQEVTSVLDFLVLMPPPPRRLYLPAEYRQLLTEIYRSLNIRFRECPPVETVLKGLSDLEVKIKNEDSIALIVVHRYGLDFIEQIGLTIRELDAIGIITVNIDLPLHDPSTPVQVKPLRDLGFILSGLAPLFHQERDYLRLQRTLVKLDFELIQVFSPMAQKLKSVIKKEYYETQNRREQAVSEN